MFTAEFRLYTEMYTYEGLICEKIWLYSDLQPGQAHLVIMPDNIVEAEIKYRKTTSNSD
jgi:hypothetical protein